MVRHRGRSDPSPRPFRLFTSPQRPGRGRGPSRPRLGNSPRGVHQAHVTQGLGKVNQTPGVGEPPGDGFDRRSNPLVVRRQETYDGEQQGRGVERLATEGLVEAPARPLQPCSRMARRISSRSSRQRLTRSALLPMEPASSTVRSSATQPPVRSLGGIRDKSRGRRRQRTHCSPSRCSALMSSPYTSS